jgi:endonuclease/exonuclease/phosphatase family metal-dependent hydrolase
MRIVSWNIRGGRGIDGIRSLQRIIETLRGFDADVICLQEVERRMPQSGLEDQPKLLARELGMRVAFQSNLSLGFGRFGNVILTRLPVKSRAEIRIPNRRERRNILRFPEKRGVLKLALDGPLAVLCTHWSLDSEDRLDSARLIVDRIRQLDYPTILAGDLNAAPQSKEIGIIREESGLIDSFPESPATYPADVPDSRIDYIWIPAAASVKSANVPETSASDHLPVVVEYFT